MRERELSEAESRLPESLPTERGSQRWSWERARTGAKYGFLFGVGLSAISLGSSSLLTDISTDIPGLARVVAFQIGYFTGIGGLVGSFKSTSEITANTWRGLSAPFRRRRTS